MSKGIEKLREEYNNIRKSSGNLDALGVSVSTHNQDFLHWKGCMPGPKDTPYSNGLFFLK